MELIDEKNALVIYSAHQAVHQHRQGGQGKIFEKDWNCETDHQMIPFPIVNSSNQSKGVTGCSI